MDILDHLEAIPNDWNEESLSLDFEIYCLGQLIATAAKSGNASNITRAMDCQTLCRNVQKKFSGLHDIADLNEKVFCTFVEYLKDELPDVDLSELHEHLTADNHVAADPGQLNNIRLSRRLLWAMTESKDVRAAIGYATSTQKVVKSLQAEATKDNRYLTLGAATNLIHRTIATAVEWLTENNPEICPETKLADAVANACTRLAQLIKQKDQTNA
jgi:hypothetical protein